MIDEEQIFREIGKDYDQDDIIYPFIYGVVKKTKPYKSGFEKPNYKDGWPYCNHCKRNMPKNIIKCIICRKPLRTQPIAKKRGLKRY